MSTTLKPLYGSLTSLTITSLNSLANGGAAGCVVVDNTSPLLDESLVSVTVVTGASGVSSSGSVTVYAYAPTDSTPHYTDGVSGTDATQTLTSPTNLIPIGFGNCVANAATYHLGPFSVSEAFGNNMPTAWGIVVVNNTGAGLASSGNSANYVPMQYQGV